jgi:hypothetical protein
MIKLTLRYIFLLILVISMTAGVLSVAYAASNSNIDPDAKWAWSANAGWIHFNHSDPVSYKISVLLYNLYLSLVMK